VLTDPEQAITLGRKVVADGRLRELRVNLGITRSAMAELLHTNLVSYADWERRPQVQLRPATAERVGRFYFTAIEELNLLKEFGLDPGGLMPFHVVAGRLGVPQEVLLDWYREGRFEAIDAGILGLWVAKATFRKLQRQR
jgi:transcriptional regulator with XRE-family HTH domain